MLAIENPLKVEGFGLVYLEAGAQGLPSLATPLGGVPEVVIHDKTGLLLGDTKPETVAAAITRLYQDPQKYDTLKSACMEWARGFSWERCSLESYGS
jgi:phosphatidylinositol alpha-1,6-mannosyltransferase